MVTNMTTMAVTPFAEPRLMASTTLTMPNTTKMGSITPFVSVAHMPTAPSRIPFTIVGCS